MNMEDTQDDSGLSEQRSRSATWWPSDFAENFGSISLVSKDENLRNKELNDKVTYDRLSYKRASQILWSTGMLSEPIPNGFYSVVPQIFCGVPTTTYFHLLSPEGPIKFCHVLLLLHMTFASLDKKLKELYEDIPALEELHALELEGLRADVILVDADKDRKLSMLKQLIVALVKGLNTKTAAVIKKIAGLVSDFYKRPNSELSPKKAAQEETSHLTENRGVQLLGQIRHGSCRPRAILFKVLADTVGLESRLVVGLPTEGASECVDSHKHMSVLVVLNSVELLVDLMRFPGQLIPLSTKAIFMTHISAAGESDSAENDSCDSPMEPNSPLYGVSEQLDPESAEKEDGLLYQRRLEASLNAAGPSLRNMMLRSNSVDRKLSLSHSEPNIAATFWRRSRRKVIAEQRTASSRFQAIITRNNPVEILLFAFPLGFENITMQQATLHVPIRFLRYVHFERAWFDDLSNITMLLYKKLSEGASTSDTRRIRRRSMSMTPEIGDDIVLAIRAVRAMNESLKQNRLLREQGESGSYSFGSNDQHNAGQSKDSSQKAMSLPSSPHEFRSQTPERSGTPGVNEELVSTWNRVLDSPMFQNKPLLPFEEWNIDFSELTVGTRVGIGEHYPSLTTNIDKAEDFKSGIEENEVAQWPRVGVLRVGSALNLETTLLWFFGEVFRGIWNGTEVAIKVFLEQDLTAENMEDFCNEISILSRLRHPNVILFLGACTKPPRLSMITEYMEMGSLYYLIHLSGQKKKLSWRRKIKMLRDICRSIIHRDLKSANCLVNKHWTVKICDFGLSRIMTHTPMKDTSSAGTPEWMAPELIRNEPFTEKCDIFSLGVIMWELSTLNRPWDRIPPERVVYAVANEDRGWRYLKDHWAR
ncbi:hypothetical protein DH2020_025021 [Rehmannia glutinosa]|uniref:Protein kinase domain-containing protein n=1 Tax=Rehmannia glutinosa TaxID=99300 RepID=A0ABR0W4I0_REHGL